MFNRAIILNTPLQTWSVAKGKSYLSVWDKYIRVLKEEKPNVIIIKNTRGMLCPARSKIVLKCMRQLNACGYEVNNELIPSPDGTLICAILKL